MVNSPTATKGVSRQYSILPDSTGSEAEYPGVNPAVHYELCDFTSLKNVDRNRAHHIGYCFFKLFVIYLFGV